MRTNRVSTASLVLPGVLLFLALVAAAAGGGSFWLLVAAALACYIGVKVFSPAQGQAGADAADIPDTHTRETDLAARVDFLERRVAELHRMVDELRVGRPDRVSAPPPPRPESPPRPAPAPRPAPSRPVPQPSVATAPRTPETAAPPPRSFDWGRTISSADLMGAKALAIAGGIVTLLGVVFFFVLAVNNGWIGPGMRVASGGVASALVFAAGLWLQRRYDTTYSALAAAGTGIAGAYMTLLAAVSLYDMVSKPVALVIAAAIAGVGVAVSLAWESELVAAFGLIGAMAVPATLIFQGGLQEVGTAFVAVVFAGSAVVAVRERWWTMLQAAAVVSVPQALIQIADAQDPHASIVVLAATFWLMYVGAGLAFQLTRGPALAGPPASFLIGSAVFAGASAVLLYGDRHGGLYQGIALLTAAAAYGALAVLLFRRAREAATLLWVLALAVGAVGLAEALTGSSLTYAWAAEAAILAWLAARVGDSRFRIASLVYLGLALFHALAYEASPDHLFEVLRHPAKGAPAVLAIALAALIFAKTTVPADDPQSKGIMRVLDPLLGFLRLRAAHVNVTLLSVAAALTAYSASLGILELAEAVWPGSGIETPFEWGHVAITATWSLAGVTAVLLALHKRSETALALAVGWFIVTVGKVLLFDVLSIEETRYAISLLVVGSAVLIAGLARQLAVPEELTGEGAGAVLASVGLLVAGALVLVPDDVSGVDGNGLVLVGAGALYSLLGAGAFARGKQRDLSTLLWIVGLVAAAVGAELLLDGAWLVLAFTAAAAALAALSVAAGERRLQVASLVYIVIGALHALIEEAPPADLVTKGEHPGQGVPSLLLVIGATAVLAWALRGSQSQRIQAIWAAGALAVYAASLSILEAAQALSHEGVQTDFQRGHTALSAFWGLLALASLYVGLRRRIGLLRVGGFVLFAVSLGKIFLFDLPSLSSVQRALSFLAVGAVLLLGGFFYQRLSAQFDDRPAV
jgi:uncharacterized membrane protein